MIYCLTYLSLVAQTQLHTEKRKHIHEASTKYLLYINQCVLLFKELFTELTTPTVNYAAFCSIYDDWKCTFLCFPKQTKAVHSCWLLCFLLFIYLFILLFLLLLGILTLLLYYYFFRIFQIVLIIIHFHAQCPRTRAYTSQTYGWKHILCRTCVLNFLLGIL